MRSPKVLLILSIILAVLVGGYVYLSRQPQKDDKSAAKTQSIELTKLDAKKINKMALSRSAGTVALEKKGDLWQYASDPSIKLDQDIVGSMANSFANLNATRVVSEDSKNLEEYGLKNPAVTASASLDDGSEKVIYLGNKTPQGKEYYLMVKDNPKVYTVSADEGNNFSYTLSDIRDRSISKINAKDINYIKIAGKDRKAIELNKNAESIWLMSQPYSTTYGGDELKISDIANSIGDMKIGGFVEDNPADYVKYGLDKPAFEIAAKDSSNNAIGLYFGSNKDDKEVYFRVEGSKAVYTMAKDKLDSINAAPYDVVSKKIYAFADSRYVDQLIIEGFGNKSTISVTRTPKNGDQNNIESTYKVNGKDMKEEDFYLSFNTIAGLEFEAENDKKIAENPEVKINYVLNKGDKKQVNISFSSYNNDFYAVFIDGKSDFLISKQQVKKELDEIQAIANK